MLVPTSMPFLTLPVSWIRGPEAARTILLFHIISARPSNQPRMVRTFLKVYMELGSYFLFLQEQIKDIIIIIKVGLRRRRPHEVCRLAP
jgi:hypothetical protein